MDRVMTDRSAPRAFPARNSRRPASGTIAVLAVAMILGMAGLRPVWAASPPRGVTPLMRPGGGRAAPEVAGDLQYFGGPVVSRLVAVSVLWGPNVDPTVADTLPLFLRDVTDSPFMDWLCEYNTLGLSGTTTSQAIGRGTFGGQVMIAPQHGGATVTDADIQAELADQIGLGALPRPEYDAQGFPKTCYVIAFPPGITITDPTGSSSCVDWCAYHGTMRYRKKPVMYAVQPDFNQGTGCFAGCGYLSVVENVESSISHELAETVTDPEVGFATQAGPPLAWFDPTNGEIGDICNGRDVEVSWGGPTFAVQQLWSNARNACVADDPSLGPAPSITGTSSAVSGDTLTLTATGGVAPYQWLFDPGTGAQVVPDRIDATLTLRNVSVGDAGKYYVFSKGSCSAQSDPWTVTVATPNYNCNFPFAPELNLCVEKATGAYKLSVLSGALAGTVLVGTGVFESITLDGATRDRFRTRLQDPNRIVATVATKGTRQKREVAIQAPPPLVGTYTAVGPRSNPPCP
jgi:hypothetical protein